MRPACHSGFAALDLAAIACFNAGMTPPKTPQDAYDTLIKQVKEISLLGSAASILHWDQETHLPTRGHEHRSNQVSLIARMVHEQFTSPRIGELLSSCESAASRLSADASVNLRELRRAYDRATKLPAALVEELSKTAVLAHQAWV